MPSRRDFLTQMAGAGIAAMTADAAPASRTIAPVQTRSTRRAPGVVQTGYTLGMDHVTSGLRGPSSGLLSWQARAESVKKLIDAGLTGKIFLSNDWYFGISIAATGAMEALDKINPDGMLFATRKVIPYLKQLGVADREIRVITVENPRRFFGGV